MRLQKIVLNGFKSFADKTEFSFEQAVTAIVGPNGCGKSNIVDAIKWVLGEQSVKSLRSGQMADVIFSGSSSRKGLGTAEVNLHISNTAGTLPIEADEVEISRRIYKSGESEYRINGKVCRLKDIREMLMDTGLGAKAYSIIEQGQVEQLLTASKQDRRVLFEEAAGISKYKAHKQQALRKLERTEQNLLRLADIVNEVQKQLRSVKLQAGKARNYLAYSERLKELQVSFSLAEYDKLSSQLNEKNADRAEVEQQFAVVSAELSRQDAMVSSLRDEVLQTEGQINRADNAFVSIQSKIEQKLQRIEFLRSRASELEQRKERAIKGTGQLAEQKQALTRELETRRDKREDCEKKLAEKKAAVAEFTGRIEEVNRQCSSLAADLEDEKSGIIDIVRRTAQLHNEVQSISSYRDNLANQKEKLTGRADTARTELERFLTEKARHETRLADIENVLEELEQSLEAKRGEAEHAAEKISRAKEDVSEYKEAKSAIRSEMSVLEDMEVRREGLGAAVKEVLRSKAAGEGRFDFVRAVAADVISAQAEYAPVVEAAMEGKADALVVSGRREVLERQAEFEQLKGRVHLYSIEDGEPFVDRWDFSKAPGVRGRVAEFVSFDSDYAELAWRLLGKVVVVEDLATAERLAQEVGDGYEFVTVSGEYVGEKGVVRLGPLGKIAGLISRKSRLTELTGELDRIEGQIDEQGRRVSEGENSRAHLEKLCKELRTAIYEANTEKTQIAGQLAGFEQNIKRLKNEQPLIAGEIDMLEKQIAESVKKEYESKQGLEELERVNHQRQAQIEKLEWEYAEKRKLGEGISVKLTDLKVELGTVAEQHKGLGQSISTLEAQLEGNRQAAEAARKEIGDCIEQLQAGERDILGCEGVVSAYYVEKEKCQRESSQLHQRVEELLAQQKSAEEQTREKRGHGQQLEERINNLRIELRELEVKREDLTERVQEELGIELADSYQGYEQEDVDWEAVRTEIRELRGKIERLGNVNVDAIDEQEELENRNEFLTSQVTDLNSSKGQLQALINRLNKKSREKFEQTFEEVRGHFQQIFRKLFGGGKADIVLEEAEDILEAGIEIVARPPGKETRSISLLSGGEKTMTAIALLFAVFKAKPSPFCLLDEVDAALDEANNERFNLLLQEYQKDSQFIIITHSKRTMSIADVLYGITMQTRGVSKKICVQFDQYEQEEAA